MIDFAQDPEFRRRRDHDAVNAERTRRLEAGSIFTVPGYGDVALQARLQDMVTLSGLLDGAQARIAAGDVTTIKRFRDRDNTDHLLTPPQIAQMVQIGTAWVEAVYNASWDIKKLDPVPADFTDDGHWPPVR
ncbi:hypothetical protein DDZ14_16070 [Maritimibacter sp. 55A14]|uniref:DUF4376 domain-containing protein n=1 Tax=Maritimibacter sp. 55A14 TaxID=2174844 RepID=UPI000D61BDE8|nr:hypothetical protein [Maritimibacter sp. 55A14]PWE29957.1 hypothetical protein DDZ14_16070 [Maritimibacter sp. 55A14]